MNGTNALLIFPILVPLVTGTLALVAWSHPRVQRWISLGGAVALLVAGIALLMAVRQDGIQVTQLGNWPAPFGISIVADLFSAMMVVIAGVIGLAVAIYSLDDIDPDREAFGYVPLLHLLLMGVCGSFLTGDLFNLFVWFEVMLIASFVLISLGGTQRQLEGAIKYVTLNLVSSAIFLSAIGILYGMAGTLNMADLARRLADVEQPGLVTTVSMLFLVAFGIKAAVFPLFFWLPASYHTPPVAISAIFAGLLTKVGVYALIRVFTLIFQQDTDYTHTIILVVAGLTMTTGVLGAVSQNEFRRILSFHIVSQIGYMLMGLALLTPLALAGAIFYIVHHIIVKTALFLVSGLVYRRQGSFDLKYLGGLWQTNPVIGLLFLVPALALAGLPPFSGFFAKLTLVQAGLQEEQYLIVVAALLVGVVTLLSMTKIWAEAFWKPAATESDVAVAPTGGRAMLGGTVMLVVISLGVSFGAAQVFDMASDAATQLLSRELYIEAVLGPEAIGESASWVPS